ncbi:MAG: hypothetical protein CMP50_01550 [Flavobacteriales bacterium]|nr:hypothetical protein [Flavobacteriales bacterium]
MFSQCVEGDCQKGEGEFKFKNGSYVGTFFNGELNGQGFFSTKRGYSYDGAWLNGAKSGAGKEIVKRTLIYEGDFDNNMRHGQGFALFEDTKYMQDITYRGQWSEGVVCGEGELTYSRQVKYNRTKTTEKNWLIGSFINGIYQGRQTSTYPDEIIWEPFSLKMENFQKHKILTEREQKKLKNPATVEGSIILSCECLENTLIFQTNAILRQELSWWSTENIPSKTKPIILNTKQREFDIIEWHARSLALALNKQKLPCVTESMRVAWSALELAETEAMQVRKTYSAETAWNPKKGMIKNKSPQEKWDNKISKKLKHYNKANTKVVAKLKKKLSNEDGGSQCKGVEPDINFSPIKRTIIKEDVLVETEHANKVHRSFRPQFPRKQQLQ